MNRIKTVLLFSTMMIFNFISAQTSSICGKVIDKQTKEPVMFASVAMYKNGVLISGTESDLEGMYCLNPITKGVYAIEVSYIGYATKKIENIKIGEAEIANINIEINEGAGINLDEVIIIDYKEPLIRQDETTQGSIVTSNEIRNLPTRNINGLAATSAGVGYSDGNKQLNIRGGRVRGKLIQEPLNPLREDYAYIQENEFQNANDSPLSTFSIDVDRASYSNLRRFINQSQMPPVDAIRIEEMINYFDYSYPQPKGEDPFSVITEYSDCPWNADHKLMHIGLQGKEIPKDDLPASNLVFLCDISGSMSNSNKLPLLQGKRVGCVFIGNGLWYG